MQGVQTQEQQVGELEQPDGCLAEGFFEYCRGQVLYFGGDKLIVESGDPTVRVTKIGEHPKDNIVI